MYAIVEIGGHQYKVQKDQRLYVNRVAGEAGDSVSFDKILLTDDGGSIDVGAPLLDGLSIDATVVEHLKADKVLVFKKKRRKGYQKLNGHRQQVSLIEITGIGKNGAKKAAPKKEAAPKNVEAKKEAPKTEAKKEVAPTTADKSKEAKKDDLKKIEGIGPKAAEALTNAGIDTFAKMAKSKPEKLSEILSEASSSFGLLKTETWPKQAQMAADGQWDELGKYQKELDGGVEKS